MFNLHIRRNDVEILFLKAISSDVIDEILFSYVPNGERTDFVIVPYEDEVI